MSEKTSLRKFEKDAFLIHQNESSRHMFLIKEGQVKVFRKEGKYITFSKEVVAGGIVGELSIMDGLPRDVSAQCLTSVTAMLIQPEEFDAVVERIPMWLKALSRSLASRIRKTIEKTERDPILYLKNSMVSLLIYFLLEEPTGIFQKENLIKQFEDVLRAERVRIVEAFKELADEDLLIESRQEIQINSVEKLEEYLGAMRSNLASQEWS